MTYRDLAVEIAPEPTAVMGLHGRTRIAQFVPGARDVDLVEEPSGPHWVSC
jgi:hypothetical protein